MHLNTRLKLAICLLSLIILWPLCSFCDVWAADSKLLWLVNPSHPLDFRYGPQQMTHVNGYPIRPEAGEAFLKMYTDMRAAGIHGLRLQSAYRPFQYQKALYDLKVKELAKKGHDQQTALTMASQSVAVPGTSEHQTGLAIDVSINGQLCEGFGNTEAGVWLKNNSDRYGFIVRYPKEKTDITQIVYEPWHLRYVGIPHSLYMRENNMCFEEYIDYIKEVKAFLYWVDEEHYYKVTYSTIPPENLEACDFSSIGQNKESGYIITEYKSCQR